MPEFMCARCRASMRLEEVPKYCPSCGVEVYFAGELPSLRTRSSRVTVSIETETEDQTRLASCATCKGTGSKYAGGPAPLWGENEPCSACGGSGYVRV